MAKGFDSYQTQRKPKSREKWIALTRLNMDWNQLKVPELDFGTNDSENYYDQTYNLKGMTFWDEFHYLKYQA